MLYLFYKGKKSWIWLCIICRFSNNRPEVRTWEAEHCSCLMLLTQRHLILSHFRPISHFTGQSAKRRSETLTQQHRTGRLCDTLCERQRLAVCLDQRLGKNCPFTVIKCVKLKMTGWRSPTARRFFCSVHGIYFLLCCQVFFVLNCVRIEPN